MAATSKWSVPSADPEGGPGVRNPPPPPRLVIGGVLCRGLMSRKGGPKVVFNLLLTIFFWLASLASIIQAYYIYTFIVLPSSILSMEQSSFLYITLIQIIIMNRIQLPIPCIQERAFSYFSCPELHGFTQLREKISGGGPPDTPHRHIYNIKLPCHLCFCREALSIVQKNHAIPKINLYVNNCLES